LEVVAIVAKHVIINSEPFVTTEPTTFFDTSTY